MPTEGARSTWTDERLDDLSRRMDQGFERVDRDIRSLRTELIGRINAQGAELGARIDAQGAELGARIEAQGAELGGRINAQGAELGARIDALQRTMLMMMTTILVGFAGVIASQIWLIATQL